MIPRLDYRGSLCDRGAVARQLAETGMSPQAARDRAAAFWIAARMLSMFRRQRLSTKEALSAFWTPGRIEVLGKHTDYAGGDSLVMATDRGFATLAAPRGDQIVRVFDAILLEGTEFEISPDLTPRAGHWMNYPMTVARRLAKNFSAERPLRGVDIFFASDLPRAAGLSSSSAMIVAMYHAIASFNRIGDCPAYARDIRNMTDLAGYLATIENGQSFGGLAGDHGVGTFGGSEDHTAILCCRPGHVSRFSYGPVQFKTAIPIPTGYGFVVGTSGVAAEKAGAAREKYNAASRKAHRIAELWRRATSRNDPHLAAALATGPESLAQMVQILEAEGMDAEGLVARLNHFIAENEQILPAAAEALAQGNVSGFGELVDRSQLAAERLLGNQVPETIYLAMSARACGAAAASAFGAGFGGAVWAMIESSGAEKFCHDWAACYRNRFPEHADTSSFFNTTAGPAALQLT